MGRKNPNLLHGMRRVLVESITRQHKTLCCDCGQKPETRRLLVVSGSGFSQTREVRCMGCGRHWLHGFLVEVERAVIRLETGEGSIRI